MDLIGGRFLLVLPGASMVKYTTPFPCIGFSGIGSKLDIFTLNFVKEKIINN